MPLFFNSPLVSSFLNQSSLDNSLNERSAATKGQEANGRFLFGPKALGTMAIAVAALTVTALALAASPALADFGITPGSFFAKTHATVPLLQNLGGIGGQSRRQVDTTAIEASPALSQAGAHPDATASFAFNHTPFRAEDDVKEVVVDLPTGFVGNPEAVPACSRAAFNAEHGLTNCPPATQVGVVTVFASYGGGEPFRTAPVYRLTTAFGQPASFGFGVFGKKILLVPRLRSDGDYGLSVSAQNISDFFGVFSSTLTFWGVPADPVHDDERWNAAGGELNSIFGFPEGEWGASAGAEPKPFLSSSTWCDSGTLDTPISIRSWQEPTRWLPTDSADPDYHSSSPAPTGCERLRFGGSAAPVGLSLQPVVHTADTPSGYDAKLTLPYSENPNGLANPTLRDTTVTLPEGVVVNPSSANGLDACTTQQIGFIGGGFPEPRPLRFSGEPAQCPDASKLGTVEVHTPLLDHPLSGDVYLAKQGDNPFGSLLAIYIAINDPETGIVVKLAGKVEADSTTGRLRTTFTDNPQLPFTELDLHFFGGPGAPLINPPTCGAKTTSSVLTPWSAPYTAPVTSTDSFDINSGPNGLPCANSEAEEPNAPAFEAGTVNPAAGEYSPFVLRLSRKDGSQPIAGLDLTLPPGLIGKLAGIPYCPDADLAAARLKTGVAEREAASCPVASLLGSVDVGAGAGPDPLHVQGKIYLAGPYKGAPFSLAIVTPAVAGPFDLGTVVVRSVLLIDPKTAQVTVKSDPIPTILQGIPLDIRSVNVNVDRPGFTLNPTSCEPMSIAGSDLSALNQSALLSDRFQVGQCRGLSFNPSFAASTAGNGNFHGASLDVKVAQKPGEANIRKVDTQLPLALPSRLVTLQKACLQAQFAANPAGCPAGSLVGTAKAITPILNAPLTGPAYLVSHGGAAFPDLDIVLQGEGITIDLVGTTDIKKGITFSNFDTVPDAPISSFELKLPGGPGALLAATKKLCVPTRTVTVSKKATRRVHGQTKRVTVKVKRIVSEPLLMRVAMTGQNGAVVHQSTKIGITGCPKTKAKKKNKAKKKRGKAKARAGRHAGSGR